jgi:hypothetical protein
MASSLPIDTTTMAPREPSICIPRVFSNITEARVAAIVRNLDLGVLERIDMIQRENDRGEKYQRVFIHFKEWYDTTEDGQPNEAAIEVRQRLLKGLEVKVVYDDPWFWKMSASKVPRPEDRAQRPRRPAPFLDLSHSAKAPEHKPGKRGHNSRGNKAKGQGRRARKAQQRANTPQGRGEFQSPVPRSAPVERANAVEPKSPSYSPTSPTYAPTSPTTPPAADRFDVGLVAPDGK